jgi:hypothetical protein
MSNRDQPEVPDTATETVYADQLVVGDVITVYAGLETVIETRAGGAYVNVCTRAGVIENGPYQWLRDAAFEVPRSDTLARPGHQPSEGTRG